MNKHRLSSLGMKITKVQALIKAVELAQRGLATEESKEVVLCMQAAHQVLESISSELSEEAEGGRGSVASILQRQRAKNLGKAPKSST